MLHTSVVKYGEDGDPVDTVRKTIADLPAYSFQLAGLPHLFYLLTYRIISIRGSSRIIFLLLPSVGYS